MGEGIISLENTLGRLKSGSASERNRANTDVQYLFRHDDSIRKIDDLSEKAWHGILDAVFQCISTERSVWLKASRTTTTDNRLENFGKTLRTVVEAGVQRLRLKTVRALLDHVTQALDTPQGYCVPLTFNYLKTLQAVFNYQPHVEHLHDRWPELVEFCLNLAARTSGQRGPESIPERSQRTSASRQSRVATPATDSQSFSGHEAILVKEILPCLRHLSEASNAPLMSKAAEIAAFCLAYFESTRSVSAAHVDAIATTNSVLSRSVSQSIKVTCDIAQRILPVIKELWSLKTADFKDHMISTLVLLLPYIAKLARDDDPRTGSFVGQLRNLTDTIFLEYSKLSIREQFHLTDLDLSPETKSADRAVFSMTDSNLRIHTSRSESTWSILYLVASLTTLMDSMAAESHNSRFAPEHRARKRHKMSLYQEEYLRLAMQPGSMQIPALQVLSFSLQLGRKQQEPLLNVVTTLETLVSHKDGLVASWSLLALSACTTQKSATHPDLQSHWIQIWQVASRKLSSTVSCRAAALLLYHILGRGLTSYSDVASNANHLVTSPDLNGPVALSDASCAFWSLLLRLHNSEAPSRGCEVRERIITWLFNKWMPSKFEDVEHTSMVTTVCSPSNILALLQECLQQKLEMGVSELYQAVGTVGQAWLNTLKNKDLLDYLLLAQPLNAKLSSGDSGFRDRSRREDSWRPSLHLALHVVDLLTVETEKALVKWKGIALDRSIRLSSDVTSAVVAMCMINDRILAAYFANTERLRLLGQNNAELTRVVCNLLSHPECDQERIDSVINLVATTLPDLHTRLKSGLDTSDGHSAYSFSSMLSKLLHRQESARLSAHDFNGDESMFIDNEFNTQLSSTRSNSSGMGGARNIVAAASEFSSYRASVLSHIKVFDYIVEASDDNGHATRLPQAAIQLLVSLSAPDLCARQAFLLALFDLNFTMSSEQIESLLEHLGTTFLEAYEYERHEIALLILLHFLSHYSIDWTNTSNESLNEYATDLYAWYANTALKSGLCSVRVGSSIVELFVHLLQLKGPEYSPLSTVPSVRTGLYDAIGLGELSITFLVANNIHELFGKYVLSKHEEVFVEFQQMLPQDSSQQEGLALRLLAFANLASRWQTLLRRCIYHIFETAGLVARSQEHAARCLDLISTALSLKDSQALYRLFSSQLLYSWMDHQSMLEIPFRIFRYPNLGTLLQESQEELFAQLAMKGYLKELEELERHLDLSRQTLLKQWFSKTAAYCYAWDTDNQNHEGEKRLQSWLGKENFLILLKLHYPGVLAILLSTYELRAASKALSKRSSNEEASESQRQSAKTSLEILNQILSISSSNQELPSENQPCFKGIKLLERIELSYKWAKADATTIWTPQIYVFVLRVLLDRLHPALGSLNKCSIVRRVRMLIALAGARALSGYPLEMSLQGLLTLVTDRQCADDALGIVQYLLLHGVQHLVQRISFSTGLILSLLLSLRTFVASTQDSTTQETQHRATIEKAQRFHKWLTKDWMSTYVSCRTKVVTEDKEIRAFSSLVRAASEAQIEANAHEGTIESRLLQELLEDQRSKRRLLSAPSFDIVLGLCCGEFAPPPHYRDDILGTDKTAVVYISEIWKSCTNPAVHQNYLLWAARALGRSYLSTGRSQFQTVNKPSYRITSEGPEPGTESITHIFDGVADSLNSSDIRKVALAEGVIRDILALSLSTELRDIMLNVISAEVARALDLQLPERNKDYNDEAEPSLDKVLTLEYESNTEDWQGDFAIALTLHAKSRLPWLASLIPMLRHVQGLPHELLPSFVHLILIDDLQLSSGIRIQLSGACNKWLRQELPLQPSNVRAWLRVLLYLRQQRRPGEKNAAERNNWLDLDVLAAARAAMSCQMYSAALLFAETSRTGAERVSRRTSATVPTAVPDELLLNVYENLDESDSFYGVQQQPNLNSVLKRLVYEGDGFKSLLFRGSQMDSEMRRNRTVSIENMQGIFYTLSDLNLNSVTKSLLVDQQLPVVHSESSASAAFTNATKLEQWDIQVPEDVKTEAATLYSVFQGLNTSIERSAFRTRLDKCLADALRNLLDASDNHGIRQDAMKTLGILTEIDEIVGSNDRDVLEDTYFRMSARNAWMTSARAPTVMAITSSRERLFSALSRSQALQQMLNISPYDARRIEVQNLLSSCSISKQLSSSQELLGSATYLSDIVPCCQAVGLDVEGQAQYQVADVLWSQGEHAISIRMLQQLLHNFKTSNDDTGMHRADLLAKLGHYTAEARLENPEEIMEKYLRPAISALKGNYQGAVAGKVAHEFATFCDTQLQSAEHLEDFEKIERVRNRMIEEISEYKETLRNTKPGGGRSHVEGALKKASRWFRIEEREYKRLKAARESFISQSLENYLLAMAACDDFDSDVLRFFSLWLEYDNDELAVAAVSAQIGKVPSHKFVLLMNQLTSRLQLETTEFQKQLADLILRMCVDHPYHTMHNIFSSTHPSSAKDTTAQSRQQATIRIADALKNHRQAKNNWLAMYRVDNIYHKFASFPRKGEEVLKTGREYPLDAYPVSKALHEVKNHKVPPATANFPLRPDADYSGVPRIIDFKPRMSIANGLSQPKIVTAIASDGRAYKQLFKGGNDDLRQDAIMEQVFEQVSKLLKNHTATRQRNLHIRNYKVLPLSATSGIMEFVQNTMPLNDYLQPAHERYHPKDLKWSACRTKINEATSEPIEKRITAFREVCNKFNPVLRHFFFERFPDPDTWFARRLAYTRSTATISILGHVLGLGDRHCHNILLDKETGEIVHIDLGVAFEAGRVLPIPEVVPFRLTRDIVDAMGINKTEGVFRRCCEFTLSALRLERGAIMTLLDVLRYDPLYSWTVSPLRAKRMQEREWVGKDGNGEQPPPGVASSRQSSHGKKGDEGGEAARSLGVVEKKLSGGLSVEAAVSELIQQAVDERNLAVLYCGWSAWA